MKKIYSLLRKLPVILLLVIATGQGTKAQIPLLSESFESAGNIPAGWAQEVVAGSTAYPLIWVTNTYNPTIASAYNGGYFTLFRSWYAPAGTQIRLKRTVPVNTVGWTNISVDFAWFTDSGFPGSNDGVYVQYSTNGSSWLTAGPMFLRYSASTGWSIKTQSLGAGAEGKATLYIAFLFNGDYGNNCSLDFTHITGNPPPPPPQPVTLGYGTSTSSFPFANLNANAHTQLLYKSSEITSAGGAPGNISALAFNFAIYSPAQTMDDFSIGMQNTTLSALPATFVGSGFTQVFGPATYQVPGTGWGTINFATPFTWDGTSNILIDICWNNNIANVSANQLVFGSAMTNMACGAAQDPPPGCGMNAGAQQPVRANVKLTMPILVGHLQGTVTTCYNGAPIAGAIVSCAGNNAITNASGAFTLLNLPVGTQTVAITAPGYISSNQNVTIMANTMTTLNACINPVPAVVSGYVKQCFPPNDPLTGAKVSFQQGTSTPISAYTDATGYYSCNILPTGSGWKVTFSKGGYCDTVVSNMTFPTGSSTMNMCLKSLANPSPWATATLNATQDAVNLSWGAASGYYEGVYDDGIQDSFAVWAQHNNLRGVKFTPCGYPVTVFGGKVHVGKPSDYNVPPPVRPPFKMYVYDATGPGGMPGSVIAWSGDVIPTTSLGWCDFTFYNRPVITSGDYYLVMKQSGDSTLAYGLAVDTTTPAFHSYSRDSVGGGSWQPEQGNYMIRALSNGPGYGQTPAYMVYRLIQGQESNPALWTTLPSMPTSITSCTDNAWPSLINGPYRWAVRGQYYGGSLSTPTFTNVIGKNWTASLTVNVNLSCTAASPENIVARLVNTQFTDTTYMLVSDSTGIFVFNNVWKGYYNLFLDKYGYNPFTLNIDILSSDTITLPLSLIKKPPRNLQVNGSTLVATWEAPNDAATVFSEDWTLGIFTNNQWTVTGNNWGINTGFGNPSPSARFSGTPPLYGGYDQYLTSKTILPTFTTNLTLQYDLFLNNVNSAISNTLSVEIWNGTTWTILKTWNNNGGNIPWTTDLLDIHDWAAGEFKIRFHAHGDGSWAINNWNIDNISVQASGGTNTIAPCILGYNFFLNNVLGGFTADTFYVIPPDQVTYGQTANACVAAVYENGLSSNTCKSFTSSFLYPPNNVIVAQVGLDCALDLRWDKPQVTPGVYPPGLNGYKIFESGILVKTISDPDSIEYIFTNLLPGKYYYRVFATYDLAAYGFPGQSGMSQGTVSFPEMFELACGNGLPFNEDWGSASFTLNGWTFEPSTQQHWVISSKKSFPAPSAEFKWDPPTSNYSIALISPTLNGGPWNCARLFLDFDYRLDDRNGGSTEKLSTEIFYEGSWHSLVELTNNGSTDWITKHTEISQVAGKGFIVRFRPNGQNSANILHWYIDNIHVTGECFPPLSLSFSQSSLVTKDTVALSWDPPACTEGNSPDGYNVYRSDSLGLPPFVKVNTSPINATQYKESWACANQSPGCIYKYYVTGIFMDSLNYTVLCESSSDTILVSETVGTHPPSGNSINVFPNPSKESVSVSSTAVIDELEVWSYLGQMMLKKTGINGRDFRFSVAEFPAGVYYMKVTGTGFGKTLKITVVH